MLPQTVWMTYSRWVQESPSQSYMGTDPTGFLYCHVITWYSKLLSGTLDTRWKRLTAWQYRKPAGFRPTQDWVGDPRFSSSCFSSRVPRLDFLHFAQRDFTIRVMVHPPILQVFAIGHYSHVFTGWAILVSLFRCYRKPVTPDVGLYPKVGEEDEEENAIHPDNMDPQGNLVITLFHEVVLADVDRDQNKLRL